MGGSWGNGLASRWGESLVAGWSTGWGPRLWVSLVLCQGGLSHRAEAALPKQGLKHPRKCVVLFSMEFRPSSGLLGEVRIWVDRDGRKIKGLGSIVNLSCLLCLLLGSYHLSRTWEHGFVSS